MTHVEDLCPHLEKDSNGIWVASRSASLSYPKEANDKCFAFEDDSFWFKHRNLCVGNVVKRFTQPSDGAFLDVGGGNGYVACGLEKLGFQTVLVEPGYPGARNAIKRGLKNVVCATIEESRFPPKSFQSIGLFDVIEHIENDVDFLKQLRSLLPSSGYVFITVPAKSWLWSAEDKQAGHYRRYSRVSLRETLRSAGYETLYETDIFRFLPIPIFLFRSLPYRLFKSRSSSEISANAPKEHAQREGIAGKSVRQALIRELKAIARGRTVRFGGSCLVVARPIAS